MKKIENALVTGASRGIGRAICLELASKGINVVVNYAGNAAAAQETVTLCENLGVKAIAVQADVSTSEGANLAINTCVEQLGSIDVLVNNAGITKDNLIMRMSEEDFDKVIDTNLKGAFLCTKAASRPMMKQNLGRIVYISSVVGVRGNAGQANYAASKAGVLGLCKSVARELARKGVTANAIAPGFIETDMTDELSETVREKVLSEIPVASLGKAQDVAHTVAFLVDEKSSYITGQVICVDGGMAI